MTKLNKKNVTEAIEGCLGNYSVIGDRCNVTRSAICHFFKKYPELRELADQDRQKLIDVAENQIAVAVKNGDINSCWKLVEQQGKNRGYGQKTQIEANVQTDMWKELDEYSKKLHKLAENPEIKETIKEEIWKQSGDTKD